MSQITTPSRRLRRVKALLNGNQSTSSVSLLPPPTAIRRILRVHFRDPSTDYEHIRNLDHMVIAKSKLAYFKLVTIQECPGELPVEQLDIHSKIHHPNVANILDLYYYQDTSFLIRESLEVSLSQLELRTQELIEWEIATIITEVLKGIVYIASLGLSCKDLTKKNVRLSLNGEVKIVLDLNLHYDVSYESLNVSQVLIDVPILAEIIEDMMVSRYHLLSDDEKWSEVALSFLSHTITGSVATLKNIAYVPEVGRFIKEIDSSDSLCSSCYVYK